jgi:hypothetical protein
MPIWQKPLISESQKKPASSGNRLSWTELTLLNNKEIFTSSKYLARGN